MHRSSANEKSKQAGLSNAMNAISRLALATKKQFIYIKHNEFVQKYVWLDRLLSPKLVFQAKATSIKFIVSSFFEIFIYNNKTLAENVVLMPPAKTNPFMAFHFLFIVVLSILWDILVFSCFRSSFACRSPRSLISKSGGPFYTDLHGHLFALWIIYDIMRFTCGEWCVSTWQF